MSLWSRRRKWVVVTGAVLGGIAIAAFLGFRTYKHLVETSSTVAVSAGAPLPVKVQYVERAQVEQMLGAEATAGESQLVPIRTSLAVARVSNVQAKLGDVVQQGQLLFEIDESVQKVAVASAQTELSVARRDLELGRKRISALEDLHRRGFASAEEVRTALQEQSTVRTRITGAELKLQEALANRAATRVVAPVSGVVSEGELHPGMVVREGTDLIKLSAIDPIYVTAKLGEDKIKQVFPGQAVTLSFYAFPGREFNGKVILINPTVDEKTRLVAVIVRLDNANLELRPGMNGVAKMKASREAVRAPGISVIAAKDGSSYVFVVDDAGVVHLRPVNVGAQGNGFAEIESGLAPGERVVVVGQAALRDNDTVRIGTEYAKDQ